MTTYGWSYEKADHLAQAVASSRRLAEKEPTDRLKAKRAAEQAHAEKVQAPQDKRARARTDCKIWVGNLTHQIDESDLFKFFQSFGKILDVQLIRDDLGGSKGFAFIVFEEHQTAVHCKDWCRLNRPHIRECSPRVDLAVRRTREERQAKAEANEQKEALRKAALEDLGVKWEYRWNNEDGAQIFGPFTSEQMGGWQNSGFFATNVCYARQVGAGDDAWEASTEIQFDDFP